MPNDEDLASAAPTAATGAIRTASHPSTIYMCIDKTVPLELMRTAVDRAVEENPANAPMFLPRMATAVFLPILVQQTWQPGRTLRVHFLHGDTRVHERIERHAHEWSRYANIRFNFVRDPGAEIRISFDQPGSWSYIGTDALTLPETEATMNFGWLRADTPDVEVRRVVLHEFGHALGFGHEHQNPAVTIPWDREAVYRFYASAPNFWSREQVDTNIFQHYDRDQSQFSEFDPQSIMLYPVPNALTIGDFEIGWNNKLSETDKRYARKVYPHERRVEQTLVVNGEPLSAAISGAGEVDTFVFNVSEAGRYRIETTGRTDVIAALYGPDNSTRLINENDDGGRRLNARIDTALAPGRYTLRVRHFSDARTGDYSIGVRTTTGDG